VTLFRLALRSQRTGIIAMSAIAAIGVVANALGFAQIVGDSPADRAAFAAQMELLGKQLSYLLPVPSRLDTLAGYLHWRWFGSVGLLLSFWALVAATGAGRGDEERGFVETWLASGVGRLRYLAARVAAFGVAAVSALAALAIATWIGAQLAKEPIALDPLVLESVSLFGLALASYGIALFIAQLVTTRRGALGLGGLVLLALYFIDAAARVSDPSLLTRISPFWLHEQNRPLLGDGLDPAATLAMLAFALVFIALAAVAFARRDLGSPLVRGRTSSGHRITRPARNPLWRLPVLAPMWQQRVWIAGWAVGLAVVAFFIVSLTKTIVDSMASGPPVMRLYLERAGLSGYSAFVGVIWFSILILSLSLYTVAQVAGWSADDAEGRLATILSAPVSRARVILERLTALLLGCAIVVAVTSFAAYLAATVDAIDLDVPRFAVASALILTVIFALGAVGHLIAAWRPRVAVIAISAVAVWSYFLQQLAPFFGWPDVVKNASLYTLYGTPMSDLNWAGTGTLVGIGIVGTVSSLRAMQRRDVGA
jgi:ABC-2 type transport system permease protein